MSEHSTLANLQMSTNVTTNVDMPNSTDLTQAVQYLLNTVQTLQHRVTTHDDLLAELTALRSENSTLKAEIANLKAQLNAASGESVAKATFSVPVSSVPTSVVEQAPTTVRPTYSAVAARNTSKPASKKRKLAAGRTFQPVDPTAPRGFDQT
ncbi:hypothetical protein G6F37_013819 [Rhizopus arrhizus]|nr:hypothetical protein G6F37_013819 [Rhizopus arrhizus]